VRRSSTETLSDNQSPNSGADRKRISLLVSWGGGTTFICGWPAYTFYVASPHTVGGKVAEASLRGALKQFIVSKTQDSIDWHRSCVSVAVRHHVKQGKGRRDGSRLRACGSDCSAVASLGTVPTITHKEIQRGAWQ
jgi:hypothetical protein